MIAICRGGGVLDLSRKFHSMVGKLINLATLVLYALKGTAGPNRFGRDPLGVEHNAEIFS